MFTDVKEIYRGASLDIRLIYLKKNKLRQIILAQKLLDKKWMGNDTEHKQIKGNNS